MLQNRPRQRLPQLDLHVLFGLSDDQVTLGGGPLMCEVTDVDVGRAGGQGGGWIGRGILGLLGFRMVKGGGKSLVVRSMVAVDTSVLGMIMFHHSMRSVMRGGTTIVVVRMVVLYTVSVETKLSLYVMTVVPSGWTTASPVMMAGKLIVVGSDRGQGGMTRVQGG
jgi:hypothetical protein